MFGFLWFEQWSRFICERVYLRSGLVFVLISHGYRMALSDVYVL